MTTKINHFSLYGIFPAVSESEINAEQYRPREKIITPNSDGSNDFACFNGIHNFWAALSASNDSGISNEIRIYSINNQVIRTIDSSDVWDGKDSESNSVENGIYIYQYTINGKYVTGTVVIAK